MQVVRQASEGVFVPLTVGGGIREFTDADGKHWSALEVASEYFRSGADKVSIGGDAVFAAEEYRRTGEKTGTSSIEQISWVSLGHCSWCPCQQHACLPLKCWHAYLLGGMLTHGALYSLVGVVSGDRVCLQLAAYGMG